MHGLAAHVFSKRVGIGAEVPLVPVMVEVRNAEMGKPWDSLDKLYEAHLIFSCNERLVLNANFYFEPEFHGGEIRCESPLSREAGTIRSVFVLR